MENEKEGWMPYLTLLDRIYHNDVILHKLKIIDENDKVWYWAKDIESFVMSMHDYEIAPPYVYLTETYTDMELADLKVKIVPAVVEFIKEEDSLSMKELMEEIRTMILKKSDRIYVKDNLNNTWCFDANSSNLIGADEQPKYVKTSENKFYESNEGDRFTTVHNDLEIASVRFKIIKEDIEKEKLKDSLIREIDICNNEIQTRLGIITELVKKLKECE